MEAVSLVEGDSETDTDGSGNTPRDVPNRWDQNEVEDTDDSDTDSVAGSVLQEHTGSVWWMILRTKGRCHDFYTAPSGMRRRMR